MYCGFGCCFVVIVVRLDYFFVVYLGDCGVVLVWGGEVIYCMIDYVICSLFIVWYFDGRCIILWVFGM